MIPSSARRLLAAAAVLALVPLAGTAAPAEARAASSAPSVSGTSHLAASLSGGDSQDLGSATYGGHYQAEATVNGDDGDTATAHQTVTSTPTDVQLFGASLASSGVTATVRNEGSVRLTPSATGRWTVTMYVESNGDQCVTGGHASFTGLPTLTGQCGGGLVTRSKTVTLTKGHTYTLDAGHPESELQGNFNFSIEASLVAPPKNTKAPKITGKAVVGKTLKTDSGSWTGSPTSYDYQWYDGSKKIKGATKVSYKVAKSDVGSKIKVVVTASNDGGSDSAASKPTSKVPQPGK